MNVSALITLTFGNWISFRIMFVICNQKVGTAANGTVNKFLIILVSKGKLKTESRTDEDADSDVRI